MAAFAGQTLYVVPLGHNQVFQLRRKPGISRYNAGATSDTKLSAQKNHRESPSTPKTQRREDLDCWGPA
eukprot:4735360-Amphidinium_carterae.1